MMQWFVARTGGKRVQIVTRTMGLISPKSRLTFPGFTCESER
jgi:hypothetical protein